MQIGGRNFAVALGAVPTELVHLSAAWQRNGEMPSDRWMLFPLRQQLQYPGFVGGEPHSYPPTNTGSGRRCMCATYTRWRMIGSVRKSVGHAPARCPVFTVMSRSLIVRG